MTFEILRNPELHKYIDENKLARFYSVDSFEYLKEVEDRFEEIIQEWNTVKDGAQYQDFAELQDQIVNGRDHWTVINLKASAVDHKTKKPAIVHDILPNSLAILKKVLGNRLLDAGVSRVVPGTNIFPHRGQFINALRCHLGLQIPKGDCKIKVNGEVQSWEQGKLLIFDDRMTHEVWNNTDQDRIVLLFDFIPDPIPGFFVATKGSNQ